VIADCLKLTVYFGETDRVGGRLLSDELLDVFGQQELRAAVLLRGVEGFGLKNALRTDRFLSLSENLPIAAVAVDERTRIEALLPRVAELVSGGLITLERARLVSGRLAPLELPEALHEATKLTLYLGRDERIGGGPAYLAVVDHLHRSGLAGATVLLGVDGTTHGRRQRARFFSRNESVPVMVISVGAGAVVNEALEGLGRLLDEPIATFERIAVCKRDGRLLAGPPRLAEQDEPGLGIWQKLMVYAGEQARHDGRPLYIQLIRRLREEGASGATAVRGIWGFSGDHPPHGDRLLQVRRRVPILTTVVDTPDRIQRWFRIVDELTDEAGLVTSELVPAYLATAPGRAVGGLRLGRPTS
jgi:PII-like signaling protein